MAVDITFASFLYDRTLALQNGSVRPNGINLHYLSMPNVGEIFRRQARYAEFDACEMSLCTYTTLHAQGDRRMIAIPVFPSRKFRHSEIFINTNSRITEPKDLIGKRIGVHEYLQTAGIWQRAHIQEHGAPLDQMEWHFGPMTGPEPDYRERIRIDLPAWMDVHFIPRDKWLDKMLDDGEIDAVIWANDPPSFMRQSPNVGRLFPNYQEVEADYFRRTGIFPIMHTVVIKREIYDRNPWVALSLCEAFVQAKADAIERQRSMSQLFSMVPWIGPCLEHQASILGPDPFVYGLEANRRLLETFMLHMQEQGLTKELVTPEEIFAPETHDAILQ